MPRDELDADSSPQLYRTLFQTSPDGILVVDRQGRILRANPRACELFGYSPGELAGRSVDTLVPQPLRAAHIAHRAAFASHPSSRPMGGALNLSGLRRDGSVFPVEIALARAPLGGSQVYIASVRDISDIVRTKQAALRGRYSAYVARFGMEALAHSDFERLLHAAAALVREAMEIDAVIVLRLAADGRRFSCEAASGVSGDLQGFEVPNDPRYLAGYVLAQRAAVVSRDLSAETRFVPECVGQLGLRAAAAVPLFDRDSVIGLITARAREPREFADSDVDFLQSIANILATVLQRASYEEHLAHAQRLDALGQLTGGVAHDFNNLLMVVSGNLQVLEELVAPGQGRELARAALAATERGAMLTRKLLAFARKQPLRPRRVALSQLLADFRDLLQRTLGENVAVEVALDPAVPAVSTDPQELETALLNLAINARDAMPRGGRLDIQVKRALLDDRMIGARPDLAPGEYACISVSDSGNGMPRAVLERAFEPFFTTKPAGKGSGLGLSMVYGFARQSGGTVHLYSEPEFGTTVRLYLPVAGEADDADARPAPEAAQPGSETVLVVEDEPGVRRVVAMFLGGIGYRVLEAADAESALRMLEGPGRVDVLFTDVVLPGMNGIELARRARSVCPGLAVLYTSGYASGSMIGKLSEDEAQRLISKPYRRDVLARAVRDAIEGRPAAG